MPNLNQPRILAAAFALASCLACDGFYEACPDGDVIGTMYMGDKERILVEFFDGQWDFRPEEFAECTSAPSIVLFGRRHLSIVENFTHIGGLTISIIDDEPLDAFNQAQRIGGIVYSEAVLDEVSGFENLTELGGLSLFASSVRTLRSLDNITDLPNGFRNFSGIYELEALGSLETTSAFQPRRVPFPQDFPMLRTVEADFEIYGGNLEVIGFNALESVGRNFFFGGYREATAWGFESLMTVGDNAEVRSNNLLDGQVVADWFEQIDVGGSTINCANGGDYEQDCTF